MMNVIRFDTIRLSPALSCERLSEGKVSCANARLGRFEAFLTARSVLRVHHSGGAVNPGWEGGRTIVDS